MVIVALVIMIITIGACLSYISNAYELVKDFEKLHKLDEETIVTYERLIKDIKEECDAALQINDYKNCKEHYKIIRTLVENKQENN